MDSSGVAARPSSISSRRCSTSAHHERASAWFGMRVRFLFLGPTGLAVGLAQKESRYTVRDADSPPSQWVPRSPAGGGDSAVLARAIVATSKSPAYAVLSRKLRGERRLHVGWNFGASTMSRWPGPQA